MLHDDDRPRPPMRSFTPAALADWSEETLRNYVEALKAEIQRAQAAIDARHSQRAAADAFFRTDRDA